MVGASLGVWGNNVHGDKYGCFPHERGLFVLPFGGVLLGEMERIQTDNENFGDNVCIDEHLHARSRKRELKSSCIFQEKML